MSRRTFGTRRRIPWRTPEQTRHDAALTGTWWRCRTHGLTQDPVILGGFAFCADDACTEEIPLVASPVFARAKRADWNDDGGAKARAARVARAARKNDGDDA